MHVSESKGQGSKGWGSGSSPLLLLSLLQQCWEANLGWSSTNKTLYMEKYHKYIIFHVYNPTSGGSSPKFEVLLDLGKYGRLHSN